MNVVYSHHKIEEDEREREREREKTRVIMVNTAMPAYTDDSYLRSNKWRKTTHVNLVDR